MALRLIRKQTQETLPKIDTRASLQSLWSHQLHYQREVTAGHDIAFLYNQSTWLKAKNVLEVGCGTGAFLEILANSFPDKDFTGVDLRASSLRSAQYVAKRNSNVEFRHRNLFDLNPKQDGKFDFIIARLVVQHLPSADRFLAKMARMLEPGGTVFIYDADDSMMKFFPRLPLVDQLFARLAKKQSALGLGRDGWKSVERLGRSFAFKTIHSGNVICPSTAPRAKANLYRMFANVAPLVVRHFEVPLDLARYQAELQSWYRNPLSYGQFGLKTLLLQRPQSLADGMRDWLLRR